MQRSLLNVTRVFLKMKYMEVTQVGFLMLQRLKETNANTATTHLTSLCATLKWKTQNLVEGLMILLDSQLVTSKPLASGRTKSCPTKTSTTATTTLQTQIDSLLITSQPTGLMTRTQTGLENISELLSLQEDLQISI